MSEITDKSINTLELGEVLKMLAHECVSEEGRERTLKLLPSKEPAEIRILQKQTSAAVSYIVRFGTPPISGAKDIRASMLRAQKGGVLNTRELLDVASLLSAARNTQKYGQMDDQFTTCLSGLFNSIVPNRFLEEKIGRAIVSEEEISDGASPELATIRRHMRAANAKARDSLQRIISSTTYSKFLQNPIITMRGDRYVVPVRSEFKNEIPGLIHDVSSSGSTFFIEPMSTVQANNELRELLSKEKKEIERILAELSNDAANFYEDITLDFELLVQLDMIFARGRLSTALRCIEPIISDDTTFSLKNARHPLLDQKKAVPVSVHLGFTFDTLIITGPNTGGKTVTLKTIGLLSLMAACGLHIPADGGSSVCVFESIFADIGDEQSIEQSLSTFSSHMKNIVEIAEQVNENSLVLFDELGAGTDPVEGAALAIEIIEYVRSRGAKVVATTHYAEMKVYAMSTEWVENASCEFDVDSLRPTYRLLIGIPGKSNAFAISRRLGLPEEIIKSAGNRIDKENADFEDVISRLEEQRQQMERAKQEAERLQRETQKTNELARQYKEQIEKEKERLHEEAKKEAREIIEETRREAQAALKEINEIRKSAEASADWQRVNDARSAFGKNLNDLEEKVGKKPVEAPPPASEREIRVGDTVTILKMGTKGNVLSIDKDRNLTLQAGILKVTVKESEVRLAKADATTNIKKYMEKSTAALNNMRVSPEVDLRGLMAEEAIHVLEGYLDSAFRSHLEEVRIIHGKGTGALRQAVAVYLRKAPHVKGFRAGRYGEGENGVTIAQLK